MSEPTDQFSYVAPNNQARQAFLDALTKDTLENHGEIITSFTFKLTPAFEAKINGSDEVTSLPDGFLVECALPQVMGFMEKPVDSVKLHTALRDATIAALAGSGIKDGDIAIHRTDQGVWISASTVDKLMAATRPYDRVTETFGDPDAKRANHMEICGFDYVLLGRVTSKRQVG